jgi:NDP-sugar pyrophosphorylase family protein
MPIQYSEEYLRGLWASPSRLETPLKGTILAAGLGRRLEPLTAYHLPKPMFPLGGKVPIAELWIRRLVQSGITDLSLNLCILPKSIRRHFDNGAKFGANVSYIEEDTPSGTLGGICKMALGSKAKRLPSDGAPLTLPEFRGSTIIAPSGDIVTNFGADLLQEMYHIHRKAGSALTMALTEIQPERRADFGTVILQRPQTLAGPISLSGRITEFVEKRADSPSCLSNASIYMIEMDLLRTLDAQRTELGVKEPFYDFGKQVFPAILHKVPYITLPKDYILWGVKYDGPWFDVGNKRDYLTVNKRALDGLLDVPMMYERLPWGFLGSNVSMDFSKVTIKAPVAIGNDCVIQPGATIGPYALIGDEWVVEAGADVSDSVLWDRYPFFVDRDTEISAVDRRAVDRHEIRRGVHVRESIVTGGCLTQNVSESTVDVREDGELAIVPIDYVPEGPRA